MSCVPELREGRSDKTRKMQWFGNDIQYSLLRFLNWSPQTKRWKMENKQTLSVDVKDRFLDLSRVASLWPVESGGFLFFFYPRGWTKKES